MKVVYIGTYPPRQCGIGTFTRNKFLAMIKQGNSQDEQPGGIIVAVNDNENNCNYPEEVSFIIQQDQQSDYIEAAKFINRSGADICILEHEFGIFGGQSGIYILPLLHRLEIPVIAVFHTVLKTPAYNEKIILNKIAAMAAKTVVMSAQAVELLTKVYGVVKEQIVIIAHGVPDLQFDQQSCKKEFKLENKKVLLTFGLISRNKGIETVIKALPSVVAKHPNVVYIVLGKTHPSVLKHSGEEYRIYLLRMVRQLQLEQHVIFMNEFVNEKKLFKYLCAADIYVTPYLNEAQITSGTLAYAIGAGCAVISTPYWHALELLSQQRGRLFNFQDSETLSSILLDLFDHPETLNAMRQQAKTYGQQTIWPKIGEKYIILAQHILSDQSLPLPKKEIIWDPLILPPLSLDHVRRMTDDTGIIQHARFGIPNLKEGYCIDDNARALLMVMMAYKQLKLPVTLDLMPVYLSYIHYMQKEDGSFRNFLSFSRHFLDTESSEDAFGRTIWALGYLMCHSPNDAYYQSGKEIFFNALPHFEQLHSLRGIANTIIGISYYLQRNPADVEVTERLKILSYKLVRQYNQHSIDNWKWFEAILTYDNALLPLSLLHATQILKDELLMDIAMESVDFLTTTTLSNGYLSVIGNEQWYAKNGTQSQYAQQPVDAMATVLLFQKAFELTKDKTYLYHLYTCFMWFLGENDLRISLYDYETKGCCDGLEQCGINRNQGAESTLAYLIAHLALLQTFEDTYNTDAKEIKINRSKLLHVNPDGVITNNFVNR